MPDDKTRAFLQELTELSKKYRMILTPIYPSRRVQVSDLDRTPFGATHFYWDEAHQRYTTEVLRRHE